MKKSILYAYQWLTTLSDTGTGVMLYIAPLFTLRLMGVHAEPNIAPYVSYIGAFVLSVGFACFYGALLMARNGSRERIEVVWLLTALARFSVAIFLIKSILFGELEPAWMTVAIFDGACAIFQTIGLSRRWLADAW